MEEAIQLAKQQALQWTHQYGYGAVVPALLMDPGGVPWPWIFLMLFAGKAGLSIPLMMFYGCILLAICDHILYFIGACGRGPFMQKMHQRWPKLAQAFEAAEAAVRHHGFTAVTLGRFFPLVGRWVGIGAGLSGVPWLQFAILDAIGIVIMVVGFGVAASWIGEKTLDAPWFHIALIWAFVGGTVITLAFIAFSAWLNKRKKALEIARAPQPEYSNSDSA